MNHSRLLVIAVALAALAACQPKTSATAAAAGDTSPPVATVNGTPISRDLYEFYIKGITGKSSADLTPQQRTAALDNLIRGRLTGEQAVKDGLDKSGDTAFLLALTRLNVLEQAESDRYLKDKQATDEELHKEYDAQIGAMPKLEYHARNIVVSTEAFAQSIIGQLEKGAKFEDVAKKESMDPAAKNNAGDLGWFTPERMIPELSAAVLTLKPGEYTHTPIKTQYGWHVVQLVETRDLTPPSFDQVKQRLVQVVQAKKFRSYQDELMRTAKIEKTEPAAAAAPATPAAPAPAAPAGAPKN
ncbi:MAG: peptidylprolyl isomerase [Proteobacteria bacterium]|nr:peptidylprolyl isomerase [Pseudomonadota bacterium]